MQFAIDEPISIKADQSANKWLSLIENWLESERERLPLWIPVALGLGISTWQVFGAEHWWLLASACVGAAFVGFSTGPSSRLKGLMFIGAVLVGIGFGAIAFKSWLYGAAPLERPWIGKLHGRVDSMEDVSARDIVRYRIYVGQHPELPPIIRVNIDKELASPEIAPGSVIEFRARLMPPPGPALPGSYDFARTAWFGGIGATGRILGPVRIIALPLNQQDFWNNARNALSTRIQLAMGTETGPVGSALLVGTRGSIEEADAEALRNSGMAHLLSVSGMHVSAVVGGTFVLVASMLALWPWLALRMSVPLASAACAAIVAILYTLLTGAEVPTVRACIAALLILVALAMGRDALSLRLLAAGATFVLLFWPEALAGPSFQLSFAAVGTIILLHDSKWMRHFMQRREEALPLRLMRQFLGLLLTGLAIELVLAPIALFHFHKSGLYGALANIAAIPLTTILVMPAQLLGLLADFIWSGLGVPFWWVATQGIRAILWIAHSVSAAPGAVALLPEMPLWAFGVAMLSGLGIALFGSRSRWLALGPLAVATITMLNAPRPDMLLTGDGQHLAVVYGDGQMALLRPRAGEYARSILGETAAIGEDAMALDDMPGAVCNPDGCSFVLQKGGRRWRILALRSGYKVPSMELAAACRRSDIVVSSRWLPWSCKPRWLKADTTLLEQTGGLAFYLADAQISSVAEENAHHPWSAYAPQRLQAWAERRAKEKAARDAPPLSKNVLPKP